MEQSVYANEKMNNDTPPPPRYFDICLFLPPLGEGAGAILVKIFTLVDTTLSMYCTNHFQKEIAILGCDFDLYKTGLNSTNHLNHS